jgi:hypothetical protein
MRRYCVGDLFHELVIPIIRPVGDADRFVPFLLCQKDIGQYVILERFTQAFQDLRLFNVSPVSIEPFQFDIQFRRGHFRKHRTECPEQQIDPPLGFRDRVKPGTQFIFSPLS